MLPILLFVVAGWTSIAAIGSILLIGEERKPITPSLAVWNVITLLGIATIAIIAGIELIGN